MSETKPLSIAKAISIAKKKYFCKIVSKGRNNYSMTVDCGIELYNKTINNWTKQEIIECVEQWESEDTTPDIFLKK